MRTDVVHVQGQVQHELYVGVPVQPRPCLPDGYCKLMARVACAVALAIAEVAK